MDKVRPIIQAVASVAFATLGAAWARVAAVLMAVYNFVAKETGFERMVFLPTRRALGGALATAWHQMAGVGSALRLERFRDVFAHKEVDPSPLAPSRRHPLSAPDNAPRRRTSPGHARGGPGPACQKRCHGR